jgi:GTP-binding protein
VPGTTRDVVEGTFTHKGRSMRILDTAGIRRKSRVTDPVEYYSVNRAIESIGRADIVFLMMDATLGIVDQDKKIAAQAVKEGRGVVLVPGKWDLQKDTSKLRDAVRDLVRFQFPVLGFAPVMPVSSVTGYGVRALLDTALSLWDQLHSRVGTGRLNQALEGWLAHYKLPVRGKNYKIRFMTQVGENPVRFVAFVNRMSGFPLGYGQYLENCIRRDLGFGQVPVAVEFKQSRKTAR